ncbi:hypothetical protein JCM21900_002934 [Sporobolomyces salmonicolor]
MSNGNIASPDLVWLLTRKQTCFTHKRPGTTRTFSAEKGNLKNLSSYRFSGLAQRRVVDISPSPSGKGIVFSYKKADTSPFAIKSAVESKEFQFGGHGLKKKVVQELDAAGRPDLYQAALARCDRIHASQQTTREPRVRASRPTA